MMNKILYFVFTLLCVFSSSMAYGEEMKIGFSEKNYAIFNYDQEMIFVKKRVESVEDPEYIFYYPGKRDEFTIEIYKIKSSDPLMPEVIAAKKFSRFNIAEYIKINGYNTYSDTRYSGEDKTDPSYIQQIDMRVSVFPDGAYVFVFKTEKNCYANYQPIINKFVNEIIVKKETDYKFSQYNIDCKSFKMPEGWTALPISDSDHEFGNLKYKFVRNFDGNMAEIDLYVEKKNNDLDLDAYVKVNDKFIELYEKKIKSSGNYHFGLLEQSRFDYQSKLSGVIYDYPYISNNSIPYMLSIFTMNISCNNDLLVMVMKSPDFNSMINMSKNNYNKIMLMDYNIKSVSAYSYIFQYIMYGADDMDKRLEN